MKKTRHRAIYWSRIGIKKHMKYSVLKFKKYLYKKKENEKMNKQQKEKMVKEAYEKFLYTIGLACTNGREKSIAITNAETAYLWAKQSLEKTK
ncbi:hypothetical protein COI63_26120 [Bacillus toyonensis]|nr:hypothetical protein COI63_26120 [Bacillus toyonensis]